jgi:hypothetical protein
MTKYRAKPCAIDGIRFASQGEGRRYAELKLLERAGAIKGLRLQPRYVIQDSFRREGKVVQAIVYVADFEYFEDGKLVVEDFKGVETYEFKIKRKMFWKRYPGIELRVTK